MRYLPLSNKDRKAMMDELAISDIHELYQDVPKDEQDAKFNLANGLTCLLYTSPSPRDKTVSRMPSSA